MNPLPSLSPDDDDLYAAAAWIGKSPRDLLASIVAAADRRRSAWSRWRRHSQMS